MLVGDYLYSRSFQMMVEIGSLKIMDVLSSATCVIAEGEVQQLTNVGNPDIDEAVYFETIQGKTAMLFEAATHSGAILAGADPQQEAALQYYGRYLGLAFQLVDDLLDYQGDAKAMGKNVGDDLAEGKPTLPLIQAMAAGTPTRPGRSVRPSARAGWSIWMKSLPSCAIPARWTTPVHGPRRCRPRPWSNSICCRPAASATAWPSWPDWRWSARTEVKAAGLA